MKRTVYGKLWEYVLTQGKEPIGYRFQVPVAGGFAVDVAREDRKIIRLLRHYFDCKQYAKIPMVKRNGILVTPFEGNTVQIDNDSIKPNFSRLMEECKKAEQIRGMLERDLKNDKMSEYADSVISDLMVLSEGLGSVSIKFLEGNNVEVRLMVEDLYNLFDIMKELYKSFGSVKVSMKLGQININNKSVKANVAFIKAMYGLLGYYSLSESPRCVKDIKGTLTGNFPVLGELSTATLKSGRDCFVLTNVISLED